MEIHKYYNEFHHALFLGRTAIGGINENNKSKSTSGSKLGAADNERHRPKTKEKASGEYVKEIPLCSVDKNKSNVSMFPNNDQFWPHNNDRICTYNNDQMNCYQAQALAIQRALIE